MFPPERVLALLRNPWGASADDVRAARLQAADLIESVERLLDAVRELPNELMADLETGFHHLNNDAAAEFNRRYPDLVAQMAQVAAKADAVEQRLHP